jgi:murein DD-endopeptidase MepM/ murein hydrolase activator NlpD
MSDLAAFDVKRYAARAALTGLVGIWLSGCSTDSTRLSESFSGNPFSNPFATASNDASAPTPRVASAPLPAAAPNADYAAAAHPSPVAVASLSPVAPATTGQIKAAPSPAPSGSANGWSAVGGSPVVVAENDTLETLSRRYGVPASAMLKTNGLTSASQIQGGMHIVVPVYSANAGASPTENAKRVAAVDAPEPAKHVKAKKSEEVAVDDSAESKPQAKAKKPVHDAVAKADPQPVKPAPKAVAPAPAVVAQANVDTKTTTIKKSPPTDSTPTASVHATDPAPAQPLTAAQADAQGVAPEFRWPARGRIIESFKAGGNDGINIAVPEGTSVRAAESGVVAYAGSELKGYGNLVLIRHPNGFVTAYANNGELDVKRGETVKRGQIIAKSGQSGNVNSPQLHFELRKGSTPVDPTNYLAGL